MLLQLQSFHVCPLAEQQQNMCPITEWECTETTNPALGTQNKNENSQCYTVEKQLF